MNERINGLWWKAQIGYNNQSCDPEVLEKFAELIVQENLQIMKQEWYDLNNSPVNPEGESPRDVGIRVGMKSEVIALMAKIRKHFGVT